jgi:hypothetical protein
MSGAIFEDRGSDMALRLKKLKKVVLASVCGMLLSVANVHADPTPPGETEELVPDVWAFKLTPSYYATTNQPGAFDLNLRANHGAHAVWLGYYQRSTEFDQARTGYEYTLQLPLLQLVPSLQVATHGFVGGSVIAQVGDSIYAILGLGRTNLHEYYNLNFDPNDSITYGIGNRLLPTSTLSLFAIKDNRLDTGQIVKHLLWRLLADDHQRWTLDLSSKHGSPAAGEPSVSGTGLSVTYDYRDYFIRLAQDQKVNFTTDNQTRLSAGLRF